MKKQTEKRYELIVKRDRELKEKIKHNSKRVQVLSDETGYSSTTIYRVLKDYS